MKIMSRLLAVLFLAVIPAANAQTVTNQPAPPPAGAAKGTEGERFDDLVRDDFFSGDPALLKRAMKLCEDTLAKNPKHAQAMVWHGSGLLFEAGQAFQTNDFNRGMELWPRALKEMEDAVKLEPDNVAVRIPRGATLIVSSKYVPDPTQARALVKTAVDDYEKVLELQKPYFDKLGVHARGELLFGLADGWFRLDDLEKSRQYLGRISKDCAGSQYARMADEWLKTTDAAILQKKSKALSCIGCHDR